MLSCVSKLVNDSYLCMYNWYNNTQCKSSTTDNTINEKLCEHETQEQQLKITKLFYMMMNYMIVQPMKKIRHVCLGLKNSIETQFIQLALARFYKRQACHVV